MYGWHDLLGDVSAKITGLTSPQLNNFKGNFRGWFYSPGNRSDITYHIPHDYAPGTDLFIHVHWSYNGSFIGGTLDMTHHVSYFKCHNQMEFPNEKPINMKVDCTDIKPFYHNIHEIQLSSSTDDSLLDTNLIEPDGVITNSFIMNKIPIIEDGDPNLPMILYVDVHYQSTDKSTKNKEPDFYN